MNYLHRFRYRVLGRGADMEKAWKELLITAARAANIRKICFPASTQGCHCTSIGTKVFLLETIRQLYSPVLNLTPLQNLEIDGTKPPPVRVQRKT